MSSILVIVHRDSVCAGDDVAAPNESRFWISDKALVNEIFRELTASGYLPSISGFNERWDASVNGVKVCTFGKNIENPSYLISANRKVLEIGDWEGYIKVKLTYFSSLN